MGANSTFFIFHLIQKYTYKVLKYQRDKNLKVQKTFTQSFAIKVPVQPLSNLSKKAFPTFLSSLSFPSFLLRPKVLCTNSFCWTANVVESKTTITPRVKNELPAIVLKLRGENVYLQLVKSATSHISNPY